MRHLLLIAMMRVLCQTVNAEEAETAKLKDFVKCAWLKAPSSIDLLMKIKVVRNARNEAASWRKTSGKEPSLWPVASTTLGPEMSLVT